MAAANLGEILKSMGFDVDLHVGVIPKDSKVELVLRPPTDVLIPIDYDFVRDEIATNWRKQEEEVIKKVLLQLLNREPTIDDAKLTKRMFHEGQPDRYDLVYDNGLLGCVVYENFLNYENTFGIKFTPAEPERFLQYVMG